MNIRKGCFSGEQHIQDTQEFIGSSDDSLFMFHPLFSFPFVVDAKHISIENSTDCHLPEYSSQMAITSFRDLVLTFEFSGFLNDWVNSYVSDDFL